MIVIEFTVLVLLLDPDTTGNPSSCMDDPCIVVVFDTNVLLNAIMFAPFDPLLA